MTHYQANSLLLLAIILFVGSATCSTLYVQNKCDVEHTVCLRGAYGKEIYNGTIKSGGQWTYGVDDTNCASCNVATFPGKTLLAEFSITGGKIWWDLSTDAGYTDPAFRFYTSAPNSPIMYCDSPTCPDGTPGDSHINNCADQYDLYVVYCGAPN